jgi:branched-chain amino acid transport system ATP-binding protein
MMQATPQALPALELNDIAIRFGGVQAVDRVSVSVFSGEFVGLIGPNGAGKTTLIRIIAGILQPDQGQVKLSGLDVTQERTATRVRRGLALTHQIVKPFRQMSVLENVVLAAGHHWTANPLRALLHVGRRAESERAAAILAKVGLAGTERRPAGSLPLGQLKRLELARALALGPSVVLLDEPLAGLNQTEAARQAETISAVNQEGVAVVLVEHNLEEVVRACRRLVVLNNGRMIANGSPQAVMADAAVRDAYIGAGRTSHAET